MLISSQENKCPTSFTAQQKSFPLRISSVNLTISKHKMVKHWNILSANNRKLHFLCIEPHRSSHPEALLGRGVWKYAANLQKNSHAISFIEITLRHGCSPVNLLYIFWAPFPKNTYGWLLLTTVKRFLILMEGVLFLVR